MCSGILPIIVDVITTSPAAVAHYAVSLIGNTASITLDMTPLREMILDQHIASAIIQRLQHELETRPPVSLTNVTEDNVVEALLLGSANSSGMFVLGGSDQDKLIEDCLFALSGLAFNPIRPRLPAGVIPQTEGDAESAKSIAKEEDPIAHFSIYPSPSQFFSGCRSAEDASREAAALACSMSSSASSSLADPSPSSGDPTETELSVAGEEVQMKTLVPIVTPLLGSPDKQLREDAITLIANLAYHNADVLAYLVSSENPVLPNILAQPDSFPPHLLIRLLFACVEFAPNILLV